MTELINSSHEMIWRIENGLRNQYSALNKINASIDSKAKNLRKPYERSLPADFKDMKMMPREPMANTINLIITLEFCHPMQ